MDAKDALDDDAFEAWLQSQQRAPVPSAFPSTKEPPSPPVLRTPTKPREAHVSLLPSQTEHVERLQRIFSRFPFAMDMSMLGAGKTFTSTFLAIERKYKHVIVVCPVSVIPKWKAMHARYDFPLRQVLGYQALRSVRFKQPKHGLLYRRDLVSGEEEFEITPAFRKMVDEGLLLIFDEVQNIKNISSQFRAAQTLIHAVTLKHGMLIGACFGSSPPKEFQSHVLLLSASPIDKHEQAVHIFRALGVMTEDRIAQQNIHSGQLEWRGLQQIRDFCARMTTTILSQAPAYIVPLPIVAYNLFQSPFKQNVSSSMQPPKLSARLFKRNAYYVIDKEGEEIVKRGLTNLQTAARWDGTGVNFVRENTAAQMASVMRSLQIIETGKIATFARAAREWLDQNHVHKCVIAVNFSDTVTDLETLLAPYSPLLLTGSTSEVARGRILEQFQTPGPLHRLLICNQSVASTGIDLDDKHGGFPRLALVSPNYSTITSYQLGHRFQRMDTKSDAQVHFVFAKRRGLSKEHCRDLIELRVLDSLSRKSQVMKETANVMNVIFPGDHEEWHEDGVQPSTIVHVPARRMLPPGLRHAAAPPPVAQFVPDDDHETTFSDSDDSNDMFPQ